MLFYTGLGETGYRRSPGASNKKKKRLAGLQLLSAHSLLARRCMQLQRQHGF